MDTLDNTEWDVVIAGTGLNQSLLALSLSRSGKRILHIDRNPYYGGNEAALSLGECEAWVAKHEAASHAVFTHAAITNNSTKELGNTRSYSVALAPQLIFGRNNLLSALVSAKVHEQLEFQAVGSWFVVDNDKIFKVPNGREDIFQDSTFDLRAKRALVKFIRHVGDPEASTMLSDETKATPLAIYLQETFGIPATAHAPILSLALLSTGPASTMVGDALPNIVRHLQSMGMYGPGFGALLPKWGGFAEVAQVACRACAVGGGVYVLNRGIAAIDKADDLSLTLSAGEKIKTTWLIGSPDELNIQQQIEVAWSRAIFIVSSSLSTLFPRTSEGGVVPACAVVNIPAKSGNGAPVYIFAHSSDSGECPAGKCILYAAVAEECSTGFVRLEEAAQDVLHAVSEEPAAILWSMHFQHNTLKCEEYSSDHVRVISDAGFDLALQDSMLNDVKAMWQEITHDDAEAFMRFDARDGGDDDE